MDRRWLRARTSRRAHSPSPAHLPVAAWLGSLWRSMAEMRYWTFLQCEVMLLCGGLVSPLYQGWAAAISLTVGADDSALLWSLIALLGLIVPAVVARMSLGQFAKTALGYAAGFVVIAGVLAATAFALDSGLTHWQGEMASAILLGLALFALLAYRRVRRAETDQG